jgi:hypothetical protein
LCAEAIEGAPGDAASGIAPASALAVAKVSASTQTSTRIARRRAMRRRFGMKLVQSTFTAENGTHRPPCTLAFEAARECCG